VADRGVAVWDGGCLVRFFFQAEDGIRDWSVTGVQTCALPIYRMVRIATAEALGRMGDAADDAVPGLTRAVADPDPDVRSSAALRSEERRVGKEGRTRGAAGPDKKKDGGEECEGKQRGPTRKAA